MASLSKGEIARLLAPYLLTEFKLEQIEHPLFLDKLSIYLDLLLRWNDRMNLTAVREPERIVQRHFGESLFIAQHLADQGTILDLGSGAGFPGVPIQLWHPQLKVTLAESQAKKATFLREVVRSLSLPTEVWSERAELLLPGRIFDTVALRAVDDPDQALRAAFAVTSGDVWLLGSATSVRSLPKGTTILERTELPERTGSWLFQLKR